MSAATATQLYVGDLPISADENFLRSLFAECGNIIPNGIILKKHRTLPKAYAFITFESHEAADKAITENNYTKLDGTPIRISWADPETKRIQQSGQGNLFINGLDKTIEVSQLHEAFSNFGEIISCYIPLTNNESRGYGYIQFRNPADAERAKTDLADASINGKKIQIMDYVKPQRRNIEETFTNIYIKPLPAEEFKADADLENLFKPYGEVQNAKLVTDDQGQSKGFGFCNMCKHEDAVTACEEINNGGKYQACRAMSKKERQAFLLKQRDEFRRMKAKETQGRNLYVKDFGEEVTDDEFKAYFEQFGEVESVKIARDPQTLESKKYGYCLYKTKEAAEAALEQTMFTPLNNTYKVFVAFFKTHEERQRELARTTREKAAAKNRAQFPIPTMQGPMGAGLGQSPMAMGGIPAMQMPTTAKDKLKQELIDRNITGTQLKNRLSSISEQQAEILFNDQEALNKWIYLVLPEAAGIKKYWHRPPNEQKHLWGLSI